MKQLAQGIASLGRGEDKMLVHMTPGEVAGLQRIAMAHGGSLTINPKTGLAEAGFLSDILGFAAPIVGGMLGGPMGAGLASGLVSYAKTGDVGKAFGAGALGYGGASLLGGLEGAGSDMMGAANTEGVQALTPPEGLAAMNANIGPYDVPVGADIPRQTITPSATEAGYVRDPVSNEYVFQQAQSSYPQNQVAPTTQADIDKIQQAAMPAANEQFAQQASDVFAKNNKSYMDKVGAGFKQVTSSGKNAMDFLSNNKLPLAATALGISSMMTPKQADPAAPKLQGTRQDFTYNQPKYGPDGRLISASSYTPMGSTPYYSAAGGSIPGFAEGVYIPQSKGIRTDIYGSNAGPIGESGKQMYKNTDKYAGLKTQINKMSPSMLSRLSKSGTDPIVQAAATSELYSRANNPNPAYMDQTPLQAAQGGIMGFDIGGSVTAGSAPVTNGDQSRWYDIFKGGMSGGSSLFGGFDQLLSQNPEMLTKLRGPDNYSYNPANQTYSGQGMGAVSSTPVQYSFEPSGQSYAPKMAAGGIASLPNEYAAGGKLLQGPGDGMSDSIPAVIKGARPQRAALAQGEFVVPADVVSHLGNGSTDAGAKRLYAMMDKIRHARTGTKKQGRQINPANFMPA